METFLTFLVIACVVYYMNTVIRREIVDWQINYMQARVDCGYCMVFLHKLERIVSSDYNPDDDIDYLDLPFICNEHQPTYWWFSVWDWDFKARLITLQLANRYTEVVDEGVGREVNELRKNEFRSDYWLD